MRRNGAVLLLCVLGASVFCSGARKRGDLPSSSNGIGKASECPFLPSGQGASPYLARFDGHSVGVPPCASGVGNPDTLQYNDHSAVLVDNSNFSIRVTPIAWINSGSGLVYTILEVRFSVKSTNALNAPALRTIAFKGNPQLSFLSCNESSPNGFNSSSFAYGSSFHTTSLSYGQVPACMDTPNVAIPLVDGVVRTQYDGGAQFPPEVYVQEPDTVVDTLNNLTTVDFSTLAPPNGSDAVAYLQIQGSPASTLTDVNSLLDIFGLTHLSSDDGLDYTSTGTHYVVMDQSGTRYEGGSVTFPFPTCTLQSGGCVAPANDSINSPTLIGSGTFVDNIDTTNAAAQDATDPQSGCYDGDTTGFTGNAQFQAFRSVWYILNVQTPGSVAISTDGSRYDTRIDVFSGKPTSAATEIACDDDYTPQSSAAQQQAHITSFTPAAAGTYYIMVSETAKPTGSVIEPNGDLTPLTGPPFDTGRIPLAASAILNLQVVTTALASDHPALSFRSQHVNTTGSAITIKISAANGNVGNITSHITGDFAIVSNGCSGVTLSGSATCSIHVAFTPTADGVRTGTLTLPSNAVIGPLTIPLSGTGYIPQATLSTTSADFGTQEVNTTSTAQKVTLTNGGDGPLSLASFSSPGSLAPFSYTTTCAASLAANSSCNFQFTFTPTSAGSFSANFAVTDDAPSGGSQQTVALSGAGSSALMPQRPARGERPPSASSSSANSTPTQIRTATRSGRTFTKQRHTVDRTHRALHATGVPVRHVTRTRAPRLKDFGKDIEKKSSVDGGSTTRLILPLLESSDPGDGSASYR